MPSSHYITLVAIATFKWVELCIHNLQCAMCNVYGVCARRIGKLKGKQQDILAK